MLLYSITDFLTKSFATSFEIAAPKTLENIQQRYVAKFPFDKIARIQSTAYYRIKNLL